MLLIDLLDANHILEGQVSRKLLEIRPGVYVGSLSKRQMEVIWDAVVSSNPKAALLVYAAKTETGISMKSIGKHRYRIVDCDGLQLVSFRKDFGKN
jgi:CRISPR-associated protein Cas2